MTEDNERNRPAPFDGHDSKRALMCVIRKQGHGGERAASPMTPVIGLEVFSVMVPVVYPRAAIDGEGIDEAMARDVRDLLGMRRRRGRRRTPFRT